MSTLPTRLRQRPPTGARLLPLLLVVAALPGCGETELLTLTATTTDGAGSEGGANSGADAGGGSEDTGNPGADVTADAGVDAADGPQMLQAIGKTRCGVFDGAVHVQTGKGPTWKRLFDANKLGFTPTAVFCPQAMWLVVAGTLPNGEARVATIDFAGPPTIAKAGSGTPVAIHGRPPGDLLAVGWQQKDGQVVSFSATPTKSPLTWQPMPALEGTVGLRALWVRPDGERVAVGASGILVRAKAGGPWQGVKLPVPVGSLNGVWGTSKGFWHAVGVGGALLIGKGAGWFEAPRSTSDDVSWRAVHGFDDGLAVAVGGTSMAMWDGKSWRDVAFAPDVPKDLDLRTVACTFDDKKRAVFVVHGDAVLHCHLLPGAKPTLTCPPPKR